MAIAGQETCQVGRICLVTGEFYGVKMTADEIFRYIVNKEIPDRLDHYERDFLIYDMTKAEQIAEYTVLEEQYDSEFTDYHNL